MAGSDENRLDDHNQAFRDPEVRAVITTRGGAGAYRIADDIDFAAVRNDPKPLVGFSDITSLHLSLLDRCLTQLLRSSALDGIVGVALGSFECCRDFIDRGLSFGFYDLLAPLNLKGYLTVMQVRSVG